MLMGRLWRDSGRRTVWRWKGPVPGPLFAIHWVQSWFLVVLAHWPCADVRGCAGGCYAQGQPASLPGNAVRVVQLC